MPLGWNLWIDPTRALWDGFEVHHRHRHVCYAFQSLAGLSFMESCRSPIKSK